MPLFVAAAAIFEGGVYSKKYSISCSHGGKGSPFSVRLYCEMNWTYLTVAKGIGCENRNVLLESDTLWYMGRVSPRAHAQCCNLAFVWTTEVKHTHLPR